MNTGDDYPHLCLIETKFPLHFQIVPIMLPWFIYLLLQLGLLSTPEEWNTLTQEQQKQYEIVIGDVVH